MVDEAKVEQAGQQMQAATRDLDDEEKKAALEAAGVPLPTLGDVPESAWQKMLHWQVWSIILTFFLALVAVFVWLIWYGADLVTSASASESAKAVGTTIVGAGLGMIGGAAAGAGATSVAKK